MYRIAICDDSREDMEEIHTMISSIMKQEHMHYKIDRFYSACQLAAAKARGKAWNLILLDIMMEQKDGIALAEELREAGDETDIVFVTSSPEYALAGYQAYPVSYLLKPLKKQELRRAAEKCLKHYRKTPVLLFPALDGGMVSVSPDEIIYMEVFRKELDIHSKGGMIKAYSSLEGAAGKLPSEKFYRCHRSYVVNLDFVEGICKYNFLMKDGFKVPIAMRSYREAQKAWMDYLS